MRKSEAIRYRSAIETGVQSLADTIAPTVVNLYPLWASGVSYAVGFRVQHNGILYRCLQEHSALAGWEPENASSMWAKVLIPDETVIPEWEQPDGTNPYMKGDKVTHNGKTWESTVDDNVWEPGVYGWNLVKEV